MTTVEGIDWTKIPELQGYKDSILWVYRLYFTSIMPIIVEVIVWDSQQERTKRFLFACPKEDPSEALKLSSARLDVPSAEVYAKAEEYLKTEDAAQREDSGWGVQEERLRVLSERKTQ